MASDPKMRQPYGPGWYDTDWTPQAAPADDAADASTLAADPRPRVSTLAGFMAIVKRSATPRRPQAALRVAPVERRHPMAGSAAYAGQTRRWVIAGGAGLLAISSLPPLPRRDQPKTDAAREDDAESGGEKT